jgi:hypothetical protein
MITQPGAWNFTIKHRVARPITRAGFCDKIASAMSSCELDSELAKAVNALELRDRFATLIVELCSRTSEQMAVYL